WQLEPSSSSRVAPAGAARLQRVHCPPSDRTTMSRRIVLARILRRWKLWQAIGHATSTDRRTSADGKQWQVGFRAHGREAPARLQATGERRSPAPQLDR